jgi:hypothetical protein
MITPSEITRRIQWKLDKSQTSSVCTFAVKLQVPINAIKLEQSKGGRAKKGIEANLHNDASAGCANDQPIKQLIRSMNLPWWLNSEYMPHTSHSIFIRE